MKENVAIKYSSITKVTELQSALELQKTTWPQESITSMQQMAAAILNGGSVIGAFEENRLIGFNYGFAGYSGHETFLASHMMAIHPDYRDRGIGMQLKLEQRLWAMRYGYRKIRWTYDPFEARNGYLNLTKLGGIVKRFLPSFYGEDQHGLPIDRFLVEWELHSERIEKSLTQQCDSYEDVSLYTSLLDLQLEGKQITGIQRPNICMDSLSCCSIPVPQTSRQFRQEQPQLFAAWHHYLRELISEAFDREFQVVKLVRTEGPAHHYVLEVKR